jgi:integrase
MIYRRGGCDRKGPDGTCSKCRKGSKGGKCRYWYSYKFHWTVEGKDGSPDEHYLIRKAAHTHNREEAKDAQDGHKHALRMGLIHPLDPWPAPKPQVQKALAVREFTKQFLAFVEVQKKAGTKRFYGLCTNRILRFAPLADAILNDVTGELISRYTQWRRSTKPEESVLTVNGDLRTLRRMFYLAQEWGLIQQAPTIHELPGGKGRDRVLSFAEEVLYLSKASPTVRDAAMLAVDTGMRPNSELFLLPWSNLRLECTKEAPYGFLHVSGGKTDAATRNIPLTPRTREMLVARKELMVGPKGAKRRCGDLRFVFPGKGNSGHLMTVQHAHERATRDAGLEPFELYCWRHTFGTRCAESGMDKFALARLMGHSSPRVAERYYIHVTEPHVTTGFERFLNYQNAGLVHAIKQQTNRLQ